MYSSYGLTFDGKCEWSSGNHYNRNVVTFDVGNSSSSHADNLKNLFLMLGKEVLLVLMKDLVHQSINFNKAKISYCLSLYYNGDISYLFVNGKEIYKFQADNKNINFPTQFCFGRISNKFNHVQ